MSSFELGSRPVEALQYQVEMFVKKEFAVNGLGLQSAL